MLQFVFADGAGTTQVAVCAHLPFVIGRDSSAHLQLSAPGVWDNHARVLRDHQSGKLIIESLGEALLLLNGERVERAFLLPGSHIQIGGAALGVSLAPVNQKNLRWAEALVWILPLLVLIFEVVLAVALR
jgi:hypothetical protein